jgi:hypothetical protein
MQASSSMRASHATGAAARSWVIPEICGEVKNRLDTARLEPYS